MKNLLKVGALALALTAVVLLFSNNNAKADEGELKLYISGAQGTCVYGTSFNYGATGFSYDARDWVGTTFDSAIGNEWNCEDTDGDDSWNVTMQLTGEGLLNTSTNDSNHTIPATRVRVQDAGATKVAGECTPYNGNVTSYAALNSVKILFGKTSALGEICKIKTTDVVLKTNITGSQAVGQYLGTLVVTVPTFDGISN